MLEPNQRTLAEAHHWVYTFYTSSHLFHFIAVARKRPRDGRSDEENEDPNRVNMKKNSWKRTKAVILDKESSRDQDADVIGKLEVKKKGDEEGKAVIALLVVRP